jgi:hypothetical protein
VPSQQSFGRFLKNINMSSKKKYRLACLQCVGRSDHAIDTGRCEACQQECLSFVYSAIERANEVIEKPLIEGTYRRKYIPVGGTNSDVENP